MRLICGDQGVDQLVQSTIEHSIQLIQSQSNAVVGHPALRKVISSNPSTAIPCANLTFSIGRDLRVLRFTLLLQQPAAKHPQRFIFVLVLTALILTFDYHTGWQMGYPDCRRGLVDVLSTGAGGTEGINP